MKKLLVLILSLCLIVTISVAAMAIESEQSSFKPGWIEVEGIEGGKILFDTEKGHIEEAEQTITQAHIPSQIDGVEVVSINSGLFHKSTALTSVIVPGTVKKIPMGAFSHCSALNSVVLAEGVSEIGISAFYNTPKLSSLQLPTSLTKIDNTAFGLTGLAEVVLPEGLTTMGNMVFYGSTKLTTVELPLSLTAMGSQTFWQCHLLKTINYNGNPEDWKQITIAENNSEIYEATLNQADGSTFTPDFGGGSQTGWINVEGIEGGKILFDTITGKITAVEDGITQAHIPATIAGAPVTDIASGLFHGMDSLTSVILPGSIGKVPMDAFSHCSSLSSVIIEEGITEIGISAFYNTPKLTNLELPSSLEIIGNTVFGLSGLVNVTIPEGVISLGNSAFYGSPKLETVSLPSTLTSMSSKIFWQCYALKTVYYPGDAQMWQAMDINANNMQLFKAEIMLEDNTIIETKPEDLGGEPSDWADQEIAEADGLGLVIIMTGLPTYTDDISREQFAEMVVNMVELATGQVIVPVENPFTDTDNLDVIKAYSTGIITGMTETTFDPEGKTNREQIATMLFRAALYIAENGGAEILTISDGDLTTFNDNEQVSDWANEAVAALNANGIMEGVSKNSLAPKASTTVEQSILLIYRMFSL